MFSGRSRINISIWKGKPSRYHAPKCSQVIVSCLPIQVEERVHGTTTEECREALRLHNWDIQKAVQLLKVWQPRFSEADGAQLYFGEGRPNVPDRKMQGGCAWVLVALRFDCIHTPRLPQGGSALKRRFFHVSHGESQNI